MSPPPAGGRDSHAARILGSGTSGIAKLIIFHPVDTVAKRLMSNKVTGKAITETVFTENAKAGARQDLLSLFPALGCAAGRIQSSVLS